MARGENFARHRVRLPEVAVPLTSAEVGNIVSSIRIGAIEKFANEVGVHRAIIAGMLRKEFGNYTAYSKIVNEYDVRGMIFHGS